MARAVLIVLDSVGCGAAEDAALYGDGGADTLGHIAEACARGEADVGRRGPLCLPHLDQIGLGAAIAASTGRLPPGFGNGEPAGLWGYGVEISRGKDTPSGHWEIAGTPVPFDWGYFPQTIPCLPEGLVAALIAEAHLPGILGDCHASGTQIIADLGGEHLRTGKPILYTSADSVLQIAVHEEAFGLDRLYEVCRIARRLCDPLNIGRVIARPFLGTSPSTFARTANRKDFAVPPPPGTLLERAAVAGRQIITIGKVGDIFAHRHTGDERKGAGNDDHVDLTVAALGELADGGLIFANYVDFDTNFGHRRDVAGYAACLEAFDARMPEILGRLREGDLLVITADHGNDPTFPGTDHTREHVPILCVGPGLAAGPIGRRESLADIAESLAQHLGLPRGPCGNSWF
jgi:phosphopentomutase